MVKTERFWAKVEQTDYCWLWKASLNRDGYGHVRVDGKTWLAHRYAYALANGAIPSGLTLDHLCRVRHCVRPDHLEPVTHAENCLRGVGAPAQNARKTHCPLGHALSGPNLAQRIKARVCRTCERSESRRYKARRRPVTW